jgi:nitrite reductase (NO-forming)
VGIVAGAALALAFPWSHGSLLSAHMALNLAGWFGAAIVGTLHTFLPSLAKTTLRFPRLQAPTFAAWSMGVASLAAGYGFGLGGLATAGWIALSVASLLLAVNVAGCLAASTGPLSLPAWVVATAQAFLVAGATLAAAVSIIDGADAALAGSARAAAAVLLVGGWLGLTVLGSLIHLLAVVVRVRDLRRPMPLPSSRLGGPVAALSVAGIGGLGVAQLADLDRVAPVAAIAMIACYALLGAWVVGLGYSVVTRARPSL